MLVLRLFGQSTNFRPVISSINREKTTKRTHAHQCDIPAIWKIYPHMRKIMWYKKPLERAMIISVKKWSIPVNTTGNQPSRNYNEICRKSANSVSCEERTFHSSKSTTWPCKRITTSTHPHLHSELPAANSRDPERERETSRATQRERDRSLLSFYFFLPISTSKVSLFTYFDCKMLTELSFFFFLKHLISWVH